MTLSISQKSDDSNSELKTISSKRNRKDPDWSELPPEILKLIFGFLMTNQFDLHERVTYLLINKKELLPVFECVDNIGAIAKNLLGINKAISDEIEEKLYSAFPPNILSKLTGLFNRQREMNLSHLLKSNALQRMDIKRSGSKKMALTLCRYLDLNFDQDFTGSIGVKEIDDLLNQKDKVLFKAWTYLEKKNVEIEDLHEICLFINDLCKLSPSALTNIIAIRIPLFHSLARTLINTLRNHFKQTKNHLKTSKKEHINIDLFIALNHILASQYIYGLSRNRVSSLISGPFKNLLKTLTSEKNELLSWAIAFNNHKEAALAYLRLKNSVFPRSGNLTYLSDELKLNESFILQCLHYVNLINKVNASVINPLMEKESFIMQALNHGVPLPISIIPEELLKIRSLVKSLLVNNIRNLQQLPKEYQEDKNLILESINSSYTPDEIFDEELPEYITNDKDFFIAIIQHCSISLTNFFDKIDPILMEDTNFLNKVYLQNPYLIESINEKRSNPFIPDKNQLLKAIKRHGGDALVALKKFIDTLKDSSFNSYSDDRELMSAAIAKSPLVLEIASEQLKDDINLVMKAVSNDGNAIRFASKRLKKSEKVILKAIAQNPEAFSHLEKEDIQINIEKNLYLKDSRYIQFLLADKKEHFLAKGSKWLKDDKKIILQTMQINGDFLKFASERLKNDREVVLLAVINSGTALSHASESIQNDKEIVKAAIQKNAKAYWSASDQLKDDPDIINLTKQTK